MNGGTWGMSETADIVAGWSLQHPLWTRGPIPRLTMSDNPGVMAVELGQDCSSHVKQKSHYAKVSYG
jgi:hypothetical protein